MEDIDAMLIVVVRVVNVIQGSDREEECIDAF